MNDPRRCADCGFPIFVNNHRVWYHVDFLIDLDHPAKEPDA